jgi:hypothetical protein
MGSKATGVDFLRECQAIQLAGISVSSVAIRQPTWVVEQKQGSIGTQTQWLGRQG